MVPGPGGGLFVSIPASAGSVLLAMLDSAGRLAAGWPVVLAGATSCGYLLPVQDGSVRVLCTPDELNRELNQGARAYAFDSKGTLLAGWPIDLTGYNFSARMVGDDLTLLVSVSGGDVIEEGQPDHAVGLVTIGADGAIGRGVQAPRFWTWPGEGWAVGPNRIAYGVSGFSGFDEGSAEVSRITALGLTGVRAGWPVSFDGLASGPAFGPGGRIVLTVGSLVRSTSRVLTFDAAASAVSASSAELPTATAEFGDTGGCGLGNPQPPLVAGDGTAFVLSWATDAVYALDLSLKVKRGWPYEPATSFVRRDSRYIREDAFCPSLSIPAVGPDSTLYLPLEASNATVGGSIVAVGPDGRLRAGWPVELKNPGAEFWSVVVGSDGTVYALAIELETSDSSSATILAIAPDSTVIWTTTVVEP
jgi:outer membrane protein assembly factor BamB